jgi:branched-chain amino acid transport system substrate-binding protein
MRYDFLAIGYSLFLTILLFIFTILSPGNSLADTSVLDKKTIKIGFIIPLTGGLAARGDDIVQFLPALKTHLESLALKHSYTFIVEDGKCGSGNSATTAAMKLINVDKVDYLITACSGETLQVAPVSRRNEIITFAVLSLHEEIKKLGDYFFRTFIDIEKSIKGFAEHLLKTCDDKISILTEENAFTFTVRDSLLSHLGSRVVLDEDFSSDSADFHTLFAKSISKGSKCMYFNAMSEQTLANLVNQARRRKMNQILFSYMMPESASFREATLDNSNNLYFIGTPEIQNSSTEYLNLLQSFRNKNSRAISYEFILKTTFDAVKSLVDATESVGRDSRKVIEFLYQYESHGALGLVSYDQNGDINDLHYVLKRLKEDGTSEVVSTLVK